MFELKLGGRGFSGATCNFLRAAFGNRAARWGEKRLQPRRSIPNPSICAPLIHSQAHRSPAVQNTRHAGHHCSAGGRAARGPAEDRRPDAGAAAEGCGLQELPGDGAIKWRQKQQGCRHNPHRPALKVVHSCCRWWAPPWLTGAHARPQRLPGPPDWQVMVGTRACLPAP